MSGLKTVLVGMGAICVAVLVIAILSVAFTDRDQPLQLAVSTEAEPAGAADISMVRPWTVQDAREGYIVAEIYQEYDPAPVQRSSWTHSYNDGVGTCSAELVVGTQQGINEFRPTPTPQPGIAHAPYRPYPEGYTFAPAQAYPPFVPLQPFPPADTTDTERPDPTHTPHPTPTPFATPFPTFTPGPTPAPVPHPTATLSPLLQAVDWPGWENRPLGIETSGMASLSVPRGTAVRSYLEIRTGATDTVGSQTTLMRSPARNAVWYDGRAHIRLEDAGGRIVIPSHRADIDAHYRSAVLHVQAYPLDRCDQLDMRWELASAVVVKTLTGQPFDDWSHPSVHPQNPDNAFVGVSYVKSTNVMTFTTAGGATIQVDLDADYPVAANQTIYVGTRAGDDNFVATDFTDPSSGTSVTGTPPLTIEVPATITSGRVAWALPASVTLTRLVAGSLGDQCDDIGYQIDCAGGTAITINGDPYKFYPYGGTVGQGARSATISWTE